MMLSVLALCGNEKETVPKLLSVFFFVLHVDSSKANFITTPNMFAPENRPGPKRKLVVQPSIFRCKLAVSFRERTILGCCSAGA